MLRWALVVLGGFALLAILPDGGTLTGSVEGIITDEAGPVLAARVEARHKMSGTVYRAQSDAAGRYELKGLRRGQYALWVSAADHNPVEITTVVVDTDRATRQDVRLNRIRPRTEITSQASP